MQAIRQQIKYDAERNNMFASQVRGMPGCENLDKCIQCGTCSSTCPVSHYMDYTPRRLVELTRSGFKKEVLSSQTIWLCSSCYSCTVECPKEIGITDIMYALKQRAIEEKTYPDRFPVPVLAQEFKKMVRQHGRVTESRLVMNLFLKTQITRIFGMARTGIDLLRTGRFSLKTETCKNSNEFATLLDSAKTD